MGSGMAETWSLAGSATLKNIRRKLSFNNTPSSTGTTAQLNAAAHNTSEFCYYLQANQHREAKE